MIPKIAAGARDRAKVVVVLVSAAALLGTDCPHCNATADLLAAPGPATPSCHEMAAPPATEESKPAPVLDCGCPSCEVEAAPIAAAPDVPPARRVRLVALQLPSPALRVQVPRGHWKPPPYPGFLENTVVLRN